MIELLHLALSPVNVIFTTLLAVVVLYWLFVAIGALDLAAVDFDVEVDLDTDIDMEMDAQGWFTTGLSFFNFGRVPFMIIFTFLILFMWSISLLLDYYIGHGSYLFALALFLPNLLISLCITKIITSPLIPVFDKLNKGEKDVDYIGLECKIILPATTNQVGQAEVNHEGNILLITVKVSENKPTPLLRGDKAVVVKQSSDLKYYLIHKI